MYVCTQKETIRERLKEIEILKARIKELEKEKKEFKEIYVCNIVFYDRQEIWTRVFFDEYDAKDFCIWNIRKHLSEMDLERSDFDEEDLSEELDYMFDRENKVQIYWTQFIF